MEWQYFRNRKIQNKDCRIVEALLGEEKNNLYHLIISIGVARDGARWKSFTQILWS